MRKQSCLHALLVTLCGKPEALGASVLIGIAPLLYWEAPVWVLWLACSGGSNSVQVGLPVKGALDLCRLTAKHEAGCIQSTHSTGISSRQE